MSTLDLGAIAMSFKGPYDPLVTYAKNNQVSYLGSTWVALQTTLGVTPIAGPYWAISADGSNIMTTLGDLQYQDTGGAARLPVGAPGQQLTVSAVNKPAWAVSDSYKTVNALTDDIPWTANPAHASAWLRTPWIINAANNYFANNALPNPACGPIKRSQARSFTLTFWAWLNSNHEIVIRGGDNAFHFLGAQSAGDTLGTRILNNFNPKNGGLRLNDYFVQLHCTGNSLLALTAQGDIFSVGSGAQGLLGQGDTNDRWLLTKVPYLGPDSTMNSLACTIVALHVGQSSGNTSDPSLSNTVQGKTVHAIDINGRVWAWGMNSYGQLGIGNSTAIISTPTLIASGNNGFITAISSNKVTQISGSGMHTMLVDSNGQGYACGHNTNGQLGIGTATDTSANWTFVPIAALTNIYQVEAIQEVSGTGVDSGSSSFALQTTGTLLATGINANGQLGNGGIVQQTTFQTITGSYSSIYLSGNGALNCTAALGGTPGSSNSTFWSWGTNANGQCGLGNVTTPQSSPVQPVASSQNTNSASAINGSLVLTATVYPRTAIAAVLPGFFNTVGGGWWTIDSNAQLWFFGTGDGYNYVDAATSTATSHQTPQKFPAPFNCADGWVGLQAASISDIAWSGSAQATTGATVFKLTDGRQFAIGADTNKRFQDDGFFSAQFRQIIA